MARKLDLEFEVLDVQIMLRGPAGQEQQARSRLAEILYDGRDSSYASHGEMDWIGLKECEYFDDAGDAEAVANLIASSASGYAEYQIIEQTKARTKAETKFIRRKNKSGRFYYIRKSDGKRVSADTWKKEQRETRLASQPDIKISIMVLDVVYRQKGTLWWWTSIRNDKVVKHAGDPYS